MGCHAAEPKPPTSLLNLPAEVRIQILRHFVPQHVFMEIWHAKNGRIGQEVDVLWDEGHLSGACLLRVCRQLSEDLLPMLYGTPVFAFQDLCAVVKFSGMVGDENLRKIKNFTLNLYEDGIGNCYQSNFVSFLCSGRLRRLLPNLDLIRLAYEDPESDTHPACFLRSSPDSRQTGAIPAPDSTLTVFVDKPQDFQVYYSSDHTCMKLARIATAHDVPDDIPEDYPEDLLDYISEVALDRLSIVLN